VKASCGKPAEEVFLSKVSDLEEEEKGAEYKEEKPSKC